ncbi:hypothetical protein CAI21_09095 [Alkalilimnicola ehrlichii]|nr:hypothetical protein CAI21_09095 [Alkalilimnicola ehrlichii]
MRDQVAMADLLVASKGDVLTAEEKADFYAFAAERGAMRTAEIEHGALPFAWLDGMSLDKPLPMHPDHAHEGENALAVTAGFDQTQPQPGRPVMRESSGQGMYACGWIFHPSDVFVADRLVAGLAAHKHMARLKGVFQLGGEALAVQTVGGRLSVESSIYRGESRIEAIADVPQDWKAIGAILQEALRTAA